MLRKGAAADVDAIRSIELRPEYRLFIGSYTVDQHLEYLGSDDAAYIVSVDEENRLDGFVILRGLLSPNMSAEIARLAVDMPERGTGRALLLAALHVAFADRNVHRVWLDVFRGNTRAQHVYRSVGFRQEGELKEAVLVDGAFHDILLFGMLQNEYRELARSRDGERTSRSQP